MKRIKHMEEQIIRVLKRFEADEQAADLPREVGMTLPTFWRRNRRLRRLVADQALDLAMLKEINSKKW